MVPEGQSLGCLFLPELYICICRCTGGDVKGGPTRRPSLLPWCRGLKRAAPPALDSVCQLLEPMLGVMGNAGIEWALGHFLTCHLSSVWIQHCLCPWQAPWCCPLCRVRQQGMPGSPWIPTVTCIMKCCWLGLVAQNRAPLLPISSVPLGCQGSGGC